MFKTSISNHIYIYVKVATPADWRNGGSCMVVPGVKKDEVSALFPKGIKVHKVPSGKV